MIEENDSDKQRDAVRLSMVNLGLPRVIILLISRSISLKLMQANISLACHLLQDGFHPAQSAFRKRIMTLGNNTFLSRLRDIIALRLQVKTNLEISQSGESKFPPIRYGTWGLITKVFD